MTVFTSKEDAKGKWGRLADGIRPEPLQTDASIVDCYYRRGQKHMTSGELIRKLVDIVSKNGNLLNLHPQQGCGRHQNHAQTMIQMDRMPACLPSGNRALCS